MALDKKHQAFTAVRDKKTSMDIEFYKKMKETENNSAKKMLRCE